MENSPKVPALKHQIRHRHWIGKTRHVSIQNLVVCVSRRGGKNAISRPKYLA